jgi:predicted dehydrogenase
MGKSIRWGVVGTGQIASCFGGDCSHVESAKLAAICSRSEEAGADYARRFGVDHTFTDLDTMLASGMIDALYIGTPNTYHAEAADKALDHGLPVLCEKPMVMTVTEAERLFAKAADKNLFLMEALWTRFLPAPAKAIELVKDGAIGDVTGFHADFSFDMPYDRDHRLYAPELGGGALYDLGVYPLNVADMVLGPASNIESQWIAAPTGVDQRAAMVYQAGDVTARLECGFDRDTPMMCTIAGTKGGIVLAPPFYGAEEVLLARDTGTFASMAHAVRQQRSGEMAGVERFTYPHAGTGLEYEIEAASRTILAGETTHSKMPPEKTLEILGIIEQALAQPPVDTITLW